MTLKLTIVAISFALSTAQAASAPTLEQLLKDKAAVEATMAQIEKTFNEGKAKFDALPETKAHRAKTEEYVKKMNDDLDKAPHAATWVKQATELRAEHAKTRARLEEIKEKIVESVSKQNK